MDLSNDSVQKMIQSLVSREEALSEELESVQSELFTIQDRYRSLEREHKMVTELLRLHGNSGDANDRDSALQGETGGFKAALISILSEAGEPMHVSDIENALTRRRIPIPGRGNTANVISHLVRASDEITRVSSGTYALLSNLDSESR